MEAASSLIVTMQSSERVAGMQSYAGACLMPKVTYGAT